MYRNRFVRVSAASASAKGIVGFLGDFIRTGGAAMNDRALYGATAASIALTAAAFIVLWNIL